MKKKIITMKPWGNFEQFTANEKSTVKILNIKKDKSISLQFHKKRDEFWKILSGRCKIIIGTEEYHAKKNDEYFIDKKIIHRIIAKSDCSILEISLGKFDEKDIIRLEDEFKRI